MTKRSLRRLRQKDRIRARLTGDPVQDTIAEQKGAGYLLVDSVRPEGVTGKLWRIIVETEEGTEWWSQPIQSVIEPKVELVEGVKSYRIEEV